MIFIYNPAQQSTNTKAYDHKFIVNLQTAYDQR